MIKTRIIKSGHRNFDTAHLNQLRTEWLDVHNQLKSHRVTNRKQLEDKKLALEGKIQDEALRVYGGHGLTTENKEEAHG